MPAYLPRVLARPVDLKSGKTTGIPTASVTETCSSDRRRECTIPRDRPRCCHLTVQQGPGRSIGGARGIAIAEHAYDVRWRKQILVGAEHDRNRCYHERQPIAPMPAATPR